MFSCNVLYVELLNVRINYKKVVNGMLSVLWFFEGIMTKCDSKKLPEYLQLLFHAKGSSHAHCLVNKQFSLESVLDHLLGWLYA